MRRSFLFMLFFWAVLGFKLEAQRPKFAAGDTLFVWASSLNLRELPGPEAKILGQLPYGSSVQILENELAPIACLDKALEPFTLEDGKKSKPFYVKGYWAKVSFEGKTGYVFDGYLSKLKSIGHGADKFGLLEQWARKSLKLKPQKVIDRTDESTWEEYRGRPDWVRVRIGHTSKSAFRQVRIKNGDFDEACMLGLKIFEASYLIEFGPERVVFKSKDDNGDCEITISKQGLWVVINLECTC